MDSPIRRIIEIVERSQRMNVSGSAAVPVRVDEASMGVTISWQPNRWAFIESVTVEWTDPATRAKFRCVFHHTVLDKPILTATTDSFALAHGIMRNILTEWRLAGHN
jgi:hypothetical protein